MRYLGPWVFLIAFILVACSPNNEPVYESRLKCPDCPFLKVSSIIDGDTFDSERGRVRLFGVDTPERGQRCYQAATHRFRELAGDVVRFQFGPRLLDRSGRLLYYVYTSAGDSIDEALIREGFGRAWRQDGQHREYLYQEEAIANANDTGCLW